MQIKSSLQFSGNYILIFEEYFNLMNNIFALVEIVPA